MTYLFRQTTPKRRADREECKHYTSYTKTLREDFNKRCGYCDDADKIRIRSFTIDHFVPQNPEGFEHIIQPNFYYNLVYACRYCNSSKSNTWPTNDPNAPNDGQQGFVEPTTDQYTQLFYRTDQGKIVSVNQDNALANYIIQTLKLWLPIHERMWKLEKIRALHYEIKEQLKILADETLRKALMDLHYGILAELVEMQDSIFAENE